MLHQIAEGIALALVFAGVVILFYFGEKPPVVEIDSSSLRIRAMYGRRVAFSEITSISLLEQNMWKIGTGFRNNGYGGWALKGHFGAGLLFVAPRTAPTIKIDRSAAESIYISFRDAAQTKLLYEKLAAALPLATHHE